MGTVWALSGDGSLAHVPQNRNRVVRGSAYACASAVHVRVRVHSESLLHPASGIVAMSGRICAVQLGSLLAKLAPEMTTDKECD